MVLIPIFIRPSYPIHRYYIPKITWFVNCTRPWDGRTSHFLARGTSHIADALQQMVRALQLLTKGDKLCRSWVSQISVKFQQPILFFCTQFLEQWTMFLAGKVYDMLWWFFITVILVGYFSLWLADVIGIHLRITWSLGQWLFRIICAWLITQAAWCTGIHRIGKHRSLWQISCWPCGWLWGCCKNGQTHTCWCALLSESSFGQGFPWFPLISMNCACVSSNADLSSKWSCMGYHRLIWTYVPIRAST